MTKHRCREPWKAQTQQKTRARAFAHTNEKNQYDCKKKEANGVARAIVYRSSYYIFSLINYMCIIFAHEKRSAVCLWHKKWESFRSVSFRLECYFYACVYV